MLQGAVEVGCVKGDDDGEGEGMTAAKAIVWYTSWQHSTSKAIIRHMVEKK